MTLVKHVEQRIFKKEKEEFLCIFQNFFLE